MQRGMEQRTEASLERTRELSKIWQFEFGPHNYYSHGKRLLGGAALERFRQTILTLSPEETAEYQKHGQSIILLDNLSFGAKSDTVIDLSSLISKPPVYARIRSFHPNSLDILISDGRQQRRNNTAHSVDFDTTRILEGLRIEAKFRTSKVPAPYRLKLHPVYRRIRVSE